MTTSRTHFVMLAEDDADEREFFQEAIESIGASSRLEIYKNGKDLVEAIKRCSVSQCYPDIVFLDLNMPILNGWETLRQIRSAEQFKKIPVIAILTTSDTDNDKQTAFEKGADAFISKPSTFESLKTIIGKAIEIDWASREKNVDDFVITP